MAPSRPWRTKTRRWRWRSRRRVAAWEAVWEAACTVLESANLRRGAMMATLRCDHPDIESFIDAKLSGAALAHFNLSVLLSDDFMRAVDEDGPWPLLAHY